MNQRRLERVMQQSEEGLQDLEHRVSTRITEVRDRVSALPSPDMLTNLQRSAMAHSDRAVVRFSQSLNRLRQDVERRIQSLESPDLSHIYQDIAQLQDQYTYIASNLNKVSTHVQRLYHLPRFEATEADVAQMKTELMQLRVNLETLNSESKTTQATLQDAIRHLDRRLRQSPSQSDPHLLKSEVRELIRAMGDLVPRREFAVLNDKFKAILDAQDSLRRQIEGAHGLGAPQNGHGAAHVRTLELEIQRLSSALEQMEGRLDDISVPFDITDEIRGTTATYLSSLQWQLATLEQATQELAEQQKQLAPARSGSLLSRVSPTQSTTTTEAIAGVQWLSAFQGQSAGAWSAIDHALFQALEDATDRVVLVWPWSAAAEFDEALVARFGELLSRQCRLEIGWCHPGDRREGKLLSRMAQQWRLVSSQRQLLKTALNQLLPLKEGYPNTFKFKILGTDEQFLVCDRAYAIVGLHALPAASSTFPSLDLRLRTTEIDIIDRLLQRFDDPTLAPEDAVAFFNRAVTRYDLRDPNGAIADYTQVLRIAPDDAVAHNNRGVIWCDQQRYQRAFEDFGQAISINPHQFAARCNRGWLHLQQGRYGDAVADFDQAAIAAPTSPIPVFYRGCAHQKAGDMLRAIADYTQTIQRDTQNAVPYCYRGAAYQQQGDRQRAIADLESAAALLHAQGEHRTLAQITQALGSLKQSALVQPLPMHTA